MSNAQEKPILQVNDVTRYYTQKKVVKKDGRKSRKQTIKAVDGVSLHISRGEILGVIGESGCGKSTLGRLLIALEPPSGGKILLDGQDQQDLIRQDNLAFRRRCQIIFQNPYDTFDPRYRIENVFQTTMKLHKIGRDAAERRRMAVDILEKGGLRPGEDFLSRFPHELSGGQLQRIAILNSMILNPSFLVCDEPISMLDVSIRADILNMISRLKTEYDTAMVFISHDIITTRYISDRIAVMYLGRIVETGETDEVLYNPRHPYTQVLISNCGSIDKFGQEGRIVIKGEPPTPINTGPGCYFAPRCRHATERCMREYPAEADLGGGHTAACHFVQQL